MVNHIQLNRLSITSQPTLIPGSTTLCPLSRSALSELSSTHLLPRHRTLPFSLRLPVTPTPPPKLHSNRTAELGNFLSASPTLLMICRIPDCSHSRVLLLVPLSPPPLLPFGPNPVVPIRQPPERPVPKWPPLILPRCSADLHTQFACAFCLLKATAQVFFCCFNGVPPPSFPRKLKAIQRLMGPRVL